MTMHINQHIDLGNSLKETRKYLARYICLIPPNSPALRHATQSLHAIDDLSVAMEKLLSIEICSHYDPRKMIPGVYRGEDIYVFYPNAKPDPQSEDIFHGWNEEEI